MQASNRIIVNTLAQYIHTIFNMLLSLYSARLVLDILGVSDYGIYALVASVVSMLSFLTNSLVGSTQRFLSISQGKGDLNELKNVFGNSLLLHIILGFFICIVLESFTPFLFDGFLNIPGGREDAAKLIYQLVVLMVYFSFIAAPYRALLVSRENIVYTSVIGMVDGILKVVLVILLPYIPIDSLEAYGWVMMTITSFNLLAYAIYSHLKYEECIFPRLKMFSLSYLKNLSKFTGWITYAAICIALRNQGLAIVLNRALSTAINAAYGIGAQISGMVSFVSSSFKNAVAPQLMSSEGGGNRERMWLLTQTSCKIPFLLLAMIGIPSMFEMQMILEFWLVEVPQNTSLFGCTFLLMQLVDQLTMSLETANRAIGKIGKYTLWTFTPKLLILPLGWLAFELGYDVWVVCILMVATEVFCMLVRIPLIWHEEGFNTWEFVREVFICSIPPVMVCVCVGSVTQLLETSFLRLLITFSLSIVLFAITAYLFSLNALERAKVDSLISKIVKRKF